MDEKMDAKMSDRINIQRSERNLRIVSDALIRANMTPYGASVNGRFKVMHSGWTLEVSGANVRIVHKIHEDRAVTITTTKTGEKIKRTVGFKDTTLKRILREYTRACRMAGLKCTNEYTKRVIKHQNVTHGDRTKTITIVTDVIEGKPSVLVRMSKRIQRMDAYEDALAARARAPIPHVTPVDTTPLPREVDARLIENERARQFEEFTELIARVLADENVTHITEEGMEQITRKARHILNDTPEHLVRATNGWIQNELGELVARGYIPRIGEYIYDSMLEDHVGETWTPEGE